MKRRVAFSDLAMDDIAAYHAHLGMESASAAARFLASVLRTSVALAESPHMGRALNGTRRSSSRVRVWRVEGFPKVLVFYRPARGSIEILRLLHGSRDVPRHL